MEAYHIDCLGRADGPSPGYRGELVLTPRIRGYLGLRVSIRPLLL
jgi:hypothetical protein